jgi:hypothetical protein
MKSNELITIFDRFDKECNAIQCPACRSFCRDWVQAGEAIFKIINEYDVDDEDIELAKNVIQVSDSVIKEKEKGMVVSNE